MRLCYCNMRAIWRIAADKYGPKQSKESVTEVRMKVRENKGQNKGREMSSDVLVVHGRAGSEYAA